MLNKAIKFNHCQSIFKFNFLAVEGRFFNQFSAIEIYRIGSKIQFC
jgi:hypothetical protein